MKPVPRGTPWWHWRSMRLHTVLVICLVAAAPVLGVWASGALDTTMGAGQRIAVQQALGVRGSMRPEAIATRFGVRVRAWEAGELVVDVDEPRRPLMEGWYRVFSGGGDPPLLADFEAELPDPLRRALVREAGPQPTAECRTSQDFTLLVCEAVVRDGARTWLVQRSNRRGLRALYDLRYRVLQVALWVGLLALALGMWIAYRWVRPIAVLRDAALERADRPLDAPPLGMQRGDEIGELAGAFDVLLAAVRSQSRAHETFVSDLAHEMKNPVAAIRSVAESLEGAGEVDPERAARMARILASSSERLQRVLSELLDLARAEAGLPGDERVAVDLGALVSGVVGAVRDEQSLSEEAVAVEAGSVGVSAVPERVEALVRNLVENAVGFSGGQPVSVAVRAEGDQAVLEVRDRGEGIPAEAVSRVFDRFYTTRGEGSGTGVGLALVKAVAEAHGGSVSVASQPGEGTAFTVRMPSVQSVRNPR